MSFKFFKNFWKARTTCLRANYNEVEIYLNQTGFMALSRETIPEVWAENQTKIYNLPITIEYTRSLPTLTEDTPQEVHSENPKGCIVGKRGLRYAYFDFDGE